MITRNVLAMVLAGGRVGELDVLTLNRPKSAVPFGGLYRVIDFPLSNLMHSGIEQVGILSQYRPFSLMNHIGNGAAWDMIGRNRYIHILPPFQGDRPSDWYRGTADAIYQNLDYIKYGNPGLVLILSGDHIYKMDYRKLIRYHMETGADVTAVFKRVPWEQASRFGQGQIEGKDKTGGRLIGYSEKSDEPLSDWASLTIYLFRAEILYEVIEQIVGRERKCDFGKDIMPTILQSFKVYGFKFYDYWGYTRTIEEFYQTNMLLLGDRPEIDPEEWKVRTNLLHRRIQDRPPSVIGSDAVVENTIFYNGCRIYGEVRNSILFPGVFVAPGAVVQDSIVMFDSQILEKSTVVRSIIDTDVIIGPATVVGQSVLPRLDDELTPISKNDLVLIGQQAIVPANVTIARGCRILPGTRESQFSKSVYSPLEVIQ